MTTSPVVRSAAVQIRSSTGPLWARIYWPPPTTDPSPLLIHFPTDTAPAADPAPASASTPTLAALAPTPALSADAYLRGLCLRSGLIVLAAPAQCGAADAKAIVGWAADHAAELEADPTHLLIAGKDAGAELAAEVRRIADDEGWPALTLLTDDSILEGIHR